MRRKLLQLPIASPRSGLPKATDGSPSATQCSSVQPGQRYLITAERAPWRQHEDLTLTVGEVYRLSEAELAKHDVTTAAAMRGEEYAILSSDDVSGLQVPCSLLLEVGVLQ